MKEIILTCDACDSQDLRFIADPHSVIRDARSGALVCEDCGHRRSKKLYMRASYPNITRDNSRVDAVERTFRSKRKGLVMREITHHIVDGMSAPVRVRVEDEPGPAGACHKYTMSGGHYHETGELGRVDFQEGPIDENRQNGVTNEALLAIVIDRLEGFQAGPYACDENQEALEATREALEALKARTRDRLDRGVEGTNEQ